LELSWPVPCNQPLLKMFPFNIYKMSSLQISLKDFLSDKNKNKQNGGHLLERLLPLLLQHLLHGEKPVFPQLNPLVAVADAGVFDESTKDHEEADAQVDVDGLHVGDLGEGGVHARHQRCHCQHRRHAQANPEIIVQELKGTVSRDGFGF